MEDIFFSAAVLIFSVGAAPSMLASAAGRVIRLGVLGRLHSDDDELTLSLPLP